MSKLKSEPLDNFFESLLKLNTIDECYNLFEDVCTINELLAIKQRFEVATLLNQGLLYNEIAKQTGASSATISRVNKCLEYGTGGYKSALKGNQNESL